MTKKENGDTRSTMRMRNKGATMKKNTYEAESLIEFEDERDKTAR